MRGSLRSLRSIICVVTAVTVVTALSTSVGGASRRGHRRQDVARYILPPGNFGGLPTTEQSRDQLPLYDALTPLRGHVTDADIQRNYLPEDFKPIGATQEIATGRPGLRLIYDAYGIPHIYGQTRGRRRVRRRMGDGSRSRSVAAVRPLSRAGRRCRRTERGRVLAGHRPAVVRAERRDRSPRHQAGATAHRHVRRQGTRDHRGRASGSRRGERVSEGEQYRDDAVHRERHHRGHRVHRFDLRRRRRR